MSGHLWHFAECEFDDLRRTLRVDGAPVDVEAKPLEVLRQLMLRAGEVVTKEELLEAVWPGVIVVDGSLATAVSKLRRALGPHADAVLTIPRVGYRLAVPVERSSSPAIRNARSTPPTQPEAPLVPRAAARPRRWAAAAITTALVATLATLAFSSGLFRRSADQGPALPTVAVLPLQNLGADTGNDFLRLALADEAATILSKARGMAVRPFATLRQYTEPPADLAALGRELGADSILTGHFQEARGRIAVTLEAIHAASGRLQWRDSFDVPADSMMALEVQLALRLRSGLAPALGGRVDGSPREPANEQAYAMFLRSTALSTDAGPNREGIALLQSAVALDDSYPPAWHALSQRYYIAARYGGGEPSLLKAAEAATEHAVTLDPDYVAPAAGLIVAQVERGEVAAAWPRAANLASRRPDAVDALFAMSYVLRYAGRLEEAADHCEQAFLLDRRGHISRLRSCAVVFLLRQDYVRAANYLHVDEASDFERALTLHMLVAQGREAEAVRVAASRVPAWSSYRMLYACAAKRPADEIAGLAAALQPSDDPETNYFTAAHLSYCGNTDSARTMLERAIRGGYCS